MYLESIFIGGDIRAQLPEEAKKFDDIDKTFKKVSAQITLNETSIEKSRISKSKFLVKTCYMLKSFLEFRLFYLKCCKE